METPPTAAATPDPQTAPRTDAQPPRPLRRDAVRNRERLLAVARELFATIGPDVPLEDIAQAAEVSRTTLYRHFTTREELLALIANDNVEQIERCAAALGADPYGAITLCELVAEIQLTNRFTTRLVTQQHAEFEVIRDRVRAAFAPVAAVAEAAGTLRPGVGFRDLLLGLRMLDAVTEIDGEDVAAINARGRAIIFHGLFTEEALAHATRAHERG